MNASLVKDYSNTTVSGYLAGFTTQVFGWMTVGVFLTGVVSFFVEYIFNSSLQLAALVTVLALPAIIIQLVLVLVLSFLGRKLNGFVALTIFIFYSLFSGVTVGIITAGYQVNSVFLAFGISALIFFTLSIYGLVTKQDLTRIGTLFMFGLFGVILASIVNLFLFLFNSPLADGLSMILSYIIVILFIAAIAYDAQRIKAYAAEAQSTGKTTSLAVSAALALYLDFINIFLSILRITGKRR